MKVTRNPLLKKAWEIWYKKASFFSYLNSTTDETTYDTVKWSLFYQGLLEGETVDKNEIEITD